MSEDFKTFDEITAPDSRNIGWVSVNTRTGEKTPFTLQRFHEELTAEVLHDGVPSAVRDHFLTARHLALYSWFVYRFTMPAQLQAYASLEYALRMTFERAGVNHPRGLRGLLQLAVSRRLLTNEHFRDWPGHEAVAETDEDRKWLATWIERMPEVFSYFRNDLAHGSFSLIPQHGLALRFCADAINQIFSVDAAADGIDTHLSTS